MAIVPAVAKADVPVLPGAEGFGITTPAGRGGQVLVVTTLADTGPGSLRAALGAVGPRVIVFEVSGTIILSELLPVKNPFVTIAGQTAPSPGVTLRGAPLTIQTHDVLVQHLRIRVGDDPAGPPATVRDGLQILGPSSSGSGAYNVVIDHVSVSWGIDENMSLWYSPHDVTIQHCLIAEGLNNSIHPEGKHSDGLLIGQDSHRVALIGNVLMHNSARNPLLKDGASVVMVNNLIYNWVANAARATLLGSTDSPAAPILASIVGNSYIRGLDTPSKARAIGVSSGIDLGTQLYKSDTRVEGVQEYSTASSIDPLVSTAPIWISPLTVRPSSQVESWLVPAVGARPADRDAVDQRVLTDLRNRQGHIIDSQNEVGGWPVLAANVRPLTLPALPNADNDGDGYTNLEEWLHLMAAEVEGQPTQAPTASLQADPATITAGQSTNLTWSTTGAATAEIQPGLGSVALSGSQSVNPSQTTTYTLTAGNGIGTTTQTTTVTVLPSTNQPPVLNPIGDKSVPAAQLLSFSLSASDAENDPLIYSSSPLPTGATLTGLTFNWTPTTPQVTSHPVTFTVSDPTGSDSESITITVTPVQNVTFSGQVAAAGQPLADVQIRLSGLGDYPNKTATETLTDAQGRFTLSNLETASKLKSAIATCQSGGSCSVLTAKVSPRKSGWNFADSAGQSSTSIPVDSASPSNVTNLNYLATPN